MLLWIIPRNDGTGLLDDEARDGDSIQVKPDSWLPNVGTQEKKSYLVIQIVDPPNHEAVTAALQEPEYGIGGDGLPIITLFRKYRIDWRAKLSAAERAIVEDSNAMLPDGPLQGGGSVTSGVVVGLFTADDIIRK